MIEIGHNLQHAIEFGTLLSEMVAVPYIVLKYYGGLRQEYAPTIEMTKTEKNNILSSKKYGLSFINFYEDVMHQSTAIKFGTRTTPELYKSFSEEKLMQAWLHPETIKIVDE
ncbi:hypothetical protein [Leuconostoc falkenbergense]|uniref:hypothetical protein n=1 Tax=Leuconostoc falkenbergense TaxID=2766470 RepID=UPI0021AA050A|nr:hypothetical protein [Leuconostoc falkenbergense]